jgi:hypothetical protein
VATQVALALAVDERLELAVASDNAYVHFACLCHTLSERRTDNQLSAVEQRTLTRLLLKVASDVLTWRAWMSVFNGYAMHYPALQIPLGAALSAVSEEAVSAYVDAIVLYPKSTQSDPGRRSVAGCLRAFRVMADPEYYFGVVHTIAGQSGTLIARGRTPICLESTGRTWITL